MGKGKAHSKGKILITNSGKQYTHQLLYALQENQIPYHFFTSFWYKPAKFPFSLVSCFPASFRKKIESSLKKRYFEKINPDFISQFPFFEIIRELSDKLFGQKYAERMQYQRDRIHDKWVASRLTNAYQLVIGYEEVSLHTFRKAKQLGIITILDLAQIHYREMELIAQKHKSFGALYQNTTLKKRINKIKEEEIALSDYIICLSAFAKDTLVKNGVSAEKIFIAHLGFDPEKFKTKKTYHLPGKVKVVFTGTVTRRKGIDIILKLYEKLSDRIELTIIGPMADAEEIVKPLKSKITWVPFTDHETLNNLLNNQDLFIFPSYLDSWAMVVVEAMACGLPIIVSENTGAKEAVVNDSGFIIKTGSLEELEEKVLYFCDRPEELERMGVNARHQVSAYTWQNYHKTISVIIEKISRDGR